MRCKGIVAAALVVLLAAFVAAQEKAGKGKAAAAKVVVIGADELSVPGATGISVDKGRILHVFEGRNPGTFYIAVKISREIPSNVAARVEDVRIQLTLGSARPVEPYAVALYRSQLEEGKPTEYKLGEKKRWLSETYYFSVGKGQRDWTITLNGEAAGKLLDHYVTLMVNNVDEVSLRLGLPDGTKQGIRGYSQAKFQFPAGTHHMILEVRRHGKLKLPWTKYRRGDFKYLAIVSDLRHAPSIPAERLKKALPRIAFAWKKYQKQKGVGGGTYNLGTVDDPIHVAVYFGRDGTPGPPYKLGAEGIEVQLAAETGKRRKSRRDFDVVKYTDARNRAWAVQPWGKVGTVEISKDAREVEGEVVGSRLTVRSVERKPSLWDGDGILSKGLVYDKDEGYFSCRTRKEGKLIVIFGDKTKEP